MRKLRLLLCFFVLLCTYFHVNAQGNCPWNVNMNVIKATCLNNGGVEFFLLTDNGDTIAIDIENKKPVDPSINLSEIKFYHQSLTNLEDTTTYYTPNPRIFLKPGTYRVGVQAQCYNGGEGSGAYTPLSYEEIIDVVGSYTVPTVAILANTATNSWSSGNRPTVPCGNTGRIQLKITDGSMPYSLVLVNSITKDTVRTKYITRAEGHSTDTLSADFKDLYTFDTLPAGSYRLYFTDACDFKDSAITWTVENIKFPQLTSIHIDPVNYNYSSGYYNIFRFSSTYLSPGDVADYLYDYYAQNMQYRVCYGTKDTSDWKTFPIWNASIQNDNSYYIGYEILDTAHHISKYCEVEGEYLTFQYRTTSCTGGDTVNLYSYRIQPYMSMHTTTNEDIDFQSVYYDSCTYHIPGVHKHTLNIKSDWYYGSWSLQTNAPSSDESWNNMYHRYVTMPITYTLKDTVTGQVIKTQTVNNINRWTVDISEIEAVYGDITGDMQLPLKLERTDSKGCVVSNNNEIHVYDKNQTIDGNHWLSYNQDYYGYTCCSRLSNFNIFETFSANREQAQPSPQRYKQTRDGAKFQITKSPRNNKYNMTATYHFDTDSWTVEKESELNNAEIESYENEYFYNEDNHSYYEWGINVKDYCIPYGQYDFRLITDCDTMTYDWAQLGNHERRIIYEKPAYTTYQECDNYFITLDAGRCKYQNIGSTNDEFQDEYVEYEQEMNTFFKIISGPANGYPTNDFQRGETIRLTIPGTYTLRMYSPDNYCESAYFDTTITYTGGTVSFDYAYAYVCDADSTVGFFYCQAKDGMAPYTYRLYELTNMEGNLLEENSTGSFKGLSNIHVGDMMSLEVGDACGRSYYVNITVTDLSSSRLAWFDGALRVTETCEGSEIDVYISAVEEDFTYHWKGPNGFDVTTPRGHIVIGRGSEPGDYTVEIGNTGCSQTLKDTVTLGILPAPKVEMSYGTNTVCPGQNVTLSFTPTQGTGTITYIIGREINSIDTFYNFSGIVGETASLEYTATSEATFWIHKVEDEICNYTIPEDTVKITLRDAATACDVTVSSPQICFDATAELTASSSTMVKPYTIRWYDNPYQQNVLKTDVIEEGMSDASFTTGKLQADSTLYVTIQDATHCETYTGTVNQWMNMDNGTTPLTCDQSIRLFDDGGSNGNYLSGKYYKHTFTSTDGNLITLSFNSFNTQLNGDVMRVYTGAEVLQDSLLALISGSNLPESLTSNGTSMTIVFVSNSATEAEGWDALVSCSALPAQANIKVLDDLSVTLSISPEMPARYGQSYTLTAVANGGQGSRYEFTWHITDKDYNEIQSSSHELASNTDIYNLDNLTETRNVWVVVKDKSDYPCTTKDKMSNLIQIEIADIALNLELSSTVNEICQGDIPMIVKIKNEGSQTANNVKVKLALPDGMSLTDEADSLILFPEINAQGTVYDTLFIRNEAHVSTSTSMDIRAQIWSCDQGDNNSNWHNWDWTGNPNEADESIYTFTIRPSLDIVNAPGLTVSSADICFGGDATIQAHSNLDYPQHFIWYADAALTQVIKDTTLENNTSIIVSNEFTNITQEGALCYVMVENSNYCPAYTTVDYRTKMQYAPTDTILMHNGSSMVGNADHIRFFDDGGADNNYAPNKRYGYLFTSVDGSPLAIYFDENNYIYNYNNNARIEIYDGESDMTPRIARYTNSQMRDKVLVATTGKMFIKFYSDDYPDQGISAHVFTTSRAMVAEADVTFKTPMTAENITTSDDRVCYGNNATLTASANINFPQTHFWYDENLNPIDTIPVTASQGHSSLPVSSVTHSTNYYVTISNNNECPVIASVNGTSSEREVRLDAEHDGETTIVTPNETINFYDEGGRNGSYHTNNNYTHTFTALQGKLNIIFNSCEYISQYDTLFLYDGEDVNESTLLYTRGDWNYCSYKNITTTGSNLTVRFKSTNNASGWWAQITSSNPENSMAVAKASVKAGVPESITTDQEVAVCFGSDAVLSASSSLSTYPQYFYWYNADRTEIVHRDTVENSGESSSYSITPTSETFYYVTVTNSDNCPINESQLPQDTDNLIKIKVTFSEPVISNNVTVNDDVVCYGQNASLTATTNDGTEKHIYWYDENFHLINDEIGTSSTFEPQVSGNTVYFVNAVETNQCGILPPSYGKFFFDASKNGGTTSLTTGEMIPFYDAGGPNENYYTPGANWTHTFVAPAGKQVRLKLDNFRTNCGHRLYIYDGTTNNNIANWECNYGQINRTYVLESGRLILRWMIDYNEDDFNQPGWEGEIGVLDANGEMHARNTELATAHVSLKSVDDLLSTITTTDATVCYGSEALLTARSTIDYPQTFYWFNPSRDTILRQYTRDSGRDTLTVTPTTEGNYYVYVTNDQNCPLPEPVHDDHIVVNMGNSNTNSYTLDEHNIIDFYDDGGINGNYSDGWGDYYYFYAPAGTKIHIHFNSIQLEENNNAYLELALRKADESYEYKYIYGTLSDTDFVSEGNYVQVYFWNNGNEVTAPGWDGYIYAETPIDIENLVAANVTFEQPTFSQNVSTNDVEACYGDEVTLTASNGGVESNYAWYDENMNFLGSNQTGNYDITAFNDATYYVNASAANECPVMPPHYGAFIFDGSRNNGTTNLTAGKSIEFFDAGGPDNNYNTPGANWTHTFRAPAGKQVTLKLNSFRTSGDHHLYIYDGTPDNSVNSWNRSGNYGNNMNYTRTSSNGILTVRWYIDNNSNANNFTYPGWEGEIGVLDDNNVMQLAHPDLAAANVSIKAPIAASEITTVDAEGCYGNEVTLLAFTNLPDYPQIFSWYDENANFLGYDTVNTGETSEWTIENITNPTIYYVSVSNATECPVFVDGNILLNQNTSGVTSIVANNTIRIYSDGSQNDTHGTFTRSFRSLSGPLYIEFEQLSMDEEDTLYIFDGLDDQSQILAKIYIDVNGNGSLNQYNHSYTSPSGLLTFKFIKNGRCCINNWSAKVSTHAESYSNETTVLLNEANNGQSTMVVPNETINFYDEGGKNGSYQFDADYTHTFTAMQGNVKVQFVEYCIDMYSEDTLYVYDGTDDTAPLLGKWNNNCNLPSVTSTGSSVTFKHTSHGQCCWSGWRAKITAVNPQTAMAQATVTVKTPLAADNITMVDGEACYGADATIQASTELPDYPQTFIWYDMNLNPVDTDVVNSANEHAEYVVENVIGERSYYVTMGNGVVCPVVVENNQIIDGVSTMPTATATLKTPLAASEITTTDARVCFGNSAILTASAPNLAFPQIHTWYDENLNLKETYPVDETMGHSTFPVPSVEGTSHYYVSVSNATECPVRVENNNNYTYRNVRMGEENGLTIVQANENITFTDQNGYSETCGDTTDRTHTFKASQGHVSISMGVGVELNNEDTLFVYDGNSTNDSLLWKWSGNQYMVYYPSFVSSGNSLTVRLKATSGNCYNGWDATVHTTAPQTAMAMATASVRIGAPESITAEDVVICYGDDAVLEASSDIAYEQTFTWYAPDRATVLDVQPISSGSCIYTVSQPTEEGTYYVMVTNDTSCQPYSSTPDYVDVLMNGEQTYYDLTSDKAFRFYDAGGIDGDYESCNYKGNTYEYHFNAPYGSRIHFHLNSIELDDYGNAYMRIYNNDWNEIGYITGSNTNLDYEVETQLIVQFYNCYDETHPGWDGIISLVEENTAPVDPANLKAINVSFMDPVVTDNIQIDDQEACYGETVTLSVNNYDPNMQYVWFDENMILAGTGETLDVTVTENTTYYVNAGAAGDCLIPSPEYNTFVFNEAKNGGTTQLTTGVAVPFYDDGGIAGDYAANANWTHTFVAPQGKQVTLEISSYDLCDDWNSCLYIYDGTSTTCGVLCTLRRYSSCSTVTSYNGALTLQWVSNNCTAAGWEGRIGVKDANDEMVVADNEFTAVHVNLKAPVAPSIIATNSPVEVCYGSETTLTASTNISYPQTYTWYGPDRTIPLYEKTITSGQCNYTFTPEENVYYVYVTNSENCPPVTSVHNEEMTVLMDGSNNSHTLTEHQFVHFYDAGGINNNYNDCWSGNYYFYAPEGTRLRLHFNSIALEDNTNTYLRLYMRNENGNWEYQYIYGNVSDTDFVAAAGSSIEVYFSNYCNSETAAGWDAYVYAMKPLNTDELASVQVNFSAPSFSQNVSTNDVEGCYGETVTLTATNGNGTSNYAWYDENMNFLGSNQTGTYNVTAMDNATYYVNASAANECPVIPPSYNGNIPQLTAAHVSIKAPVGPSVITTTDGEGCYGGEATLTATSTLDGTQHFYWYDGLEPAFDETVNAGEASHFVINNVTGTKTYYVTVGNGEECPVFVPETLGTTRWINANLDEEHNGTTTMVMPNDQIDFYDEGGSGSFTSHSYTRTFKALQGQLYVENYDYVSLPDGDVLYVYDGEDDSTEPIAQWSGSSYPSTSFTTTGSSVTFKLVGHDQCCWDGWHAVIRVANPDPTPYMASATVSLKAPYSRDSIMVTDAEICFGDSATMKAMANISYPQYYTWYDPSRMEVLKRETVTAGYSTLKVLPSAENTYYVAVSCDTTCAIRDVEHDNYREILMNNSSYSSQSIWVTAMDSIGFYDAGGEQNNSYYSGWSYHDCYFDTDEDSYFKVHFNSLYIGGGHMVIYDTKHDKQIAYFTGGNTYTDKDYVISSNRIRIYHYSHSNSADWDGYIYAIVPHNSSELAEAHVTFKAPIAASEINTVDGQACYGYETNLSVSSDIAVPQYFTWYDEDYNFMFMDTVDVAGGNSVHHIDHVTGTQNYYVTLYNATECPVTLNKEVLLNDNSNGETTTLTSQMNVDFYDQGGVESYQSRYDNLTHTFTAVDGQVYVTFVDEPRMNGSDQLYIYDGISDNGALLGTVNRDNQSSTPRTFQSTQGSLTFKLEQHGSCCEQGWHAVVTTHPVELAQNNAPGVSDNRIILMSPSTAGNTTTLSSGETVYFYDEDKHNGCCTTYTSNYYQQTFTANSGNIQVTVNSCIDLCDNLTLSVYDGTDNNATLLGSWSGWSNCDNPTLTSSGTSLTFYLSSNDDCWCYSGWDMTVSNINANSVTNAEAAMVTASVKVVEPSSIVTTDDEICYGDSATLTASSEIAVPQYYFWYGPDRMDVVKYDTVWTEGTHSEFSVLTGMEETYYVTVTNDTTCPFVEPIHNHVKNVVVAENFQTSSINVELASNDSVVFCDAGGPDGNIDFRNNDNGSCWDQSVYFTAENGSYIHVHLDYLDGGNSDARFTIYDEENGREIAYFRRSAVDKDYLIKSTRVRLSFSNDCDRKSFRGWLGSVYAVSPRDANELAEARVRFKAPVGPSSLTTNDPVEVCYGSDVTLTASSTLDADQYFVWYDEDRVNILKRDTVHTVGQNSTLTVTPDENNTTYYVAVTNAANCPILENIHTHYSEVLIGYSYQLLPYDSIGFFDDGGKNGNYQANSSSRSSYFTAEDGSHIRIHIDTINLARRAQLRITDEENNQVIANFNGPLDTANLDFVVESNRIYCYFDNDKSSLTAMGWNAYIYAITPHNEDDLVEVNVEFMDPTIADQNDVTVTEVEACYGETVTLTASVETIEPQRFVWYDEESNVVKDEVSTGSNSLTVVATEEAFYYVNVSSPEECPVLPPYEGIDDYALPYGHIILKAGVAGTEITTVDDEVCFGAEAMLTASSTIDFPQYYTWFAPDRITILKQETVNEGGHSTLTVTPEEEEDYYVAVTNNDNCPIIEQIHNHYVEILMDGQNNGYTLSQNDSVRFFDSGGRTNNYRTGWSGDYNFYADEGSHIRIHFDTVKLARNAYIQIYSGDNYNNSVAYITGSRGNLDTVVESNRLRIYFNGYSDMSAPGWDAYVYSLNPRDENELASAHVSFMQPTINNTMITTTDAEGCYSTTDTLSAISTLTENQYFAWYDNEMNLLRQEVIPSGEHSELPIEVLANTTYYVNVSTENECPVLPPHYGEFWFNASVNGRTTNLSEGEGVLFYDEAGSDGRYTTSTANWTHTFVAPAGKQVVVDLDYMRSDCGHRLEFYEGTTTDYYYQNNQPISSYECGWHSNVHVESSGNIMTVRWIINYNEYSMGNYDGWDGVIGVQDDGGNISTNSFDMAEAHVNVTAPTWNLPVTTTNDTVCYGNAAYLTATSTIDYPQHYIWYAPDARTILLRDTVDGVFKTESELDAPYYYHYQDQTYYVAIGNETNCPPVLETETTPRTVLLNASAHNQTTVLAENESAKFYDAGGLNESYHDHNSDYTHTFQAVHGTLMVQFKDNNMDIYRYDTLYVYDSDHADETRLLGKVINDWDDDLDQRVMNYEGLKYYSTGQYMTFRFQQGNNNNWYSGWNATVMPYNLESELATAEVNVKISSVPEMAVTTMSDTVCYGSAATVSASADLQYPQYYIWYNDQMEVLKQDTLVAGETESVLSLPPHYNNETYYAYVYSDTVSCLMNMDAMPKQYSELYLNTNMDGGITTVHPYDSIGFFSDGVLQGSNNRSLDMDYYFTAENGLIRIHFDEVELTYETWMEFQDDGYDIEFMELEENTYYDVTITSLSNTLHIDFGSKSSDRATAYWRGTVTNVNVVNSAVLSKMAQANVAVEINNSVNTVTTTNDTVCIGSPAMLTASSDIAYPQYYTWYNDDLSSILFEDTIASGSSNFYIPGQVGNATYRAMVSNDTTCTLRPVQVHNNFKEFVFDANMSGHTIFVGAIDSVVIYDDGGKDGNYTVPEDERILILKVETYPGATLNFRVPMAQLYEADDDLELVIVEPDENGNIGEGSIGMMLMGSINDEISYSTTGNEAFVAWVMYGTDLLPMPGFEMVVTADLHPEQHLAEAQVIMKNNLPMDYNALTNATSTVICQGDNAELEATSNLTENPQYFLWYSNDLSRVIGADTVYSGSISHVSIPNLMQDTLLYVAVGTDDVCPAYPMGHKLISELNLNPTTNAHTTYLSAVDSVLFYDDGGKNNRYTFQNGYLYRTFKASSGHVVFNLHELSITDCDDENFLGVLDGEFDIQNVDEDSIRAMYYAEEIPAGDSIIISTGNTLSVVFVSDHMHEEEPNNGWFASVYTTEQVSADMSVLAQAEVTVNPSYQFEVYDTTNASRAPYSTADNMFRNIDVSAEGELIIDSVFHTALGCDSTYTLHLMVLPATVQDIIIASNSNSWTYDGWYHREEVYTVVYGLDTLTADAGSDGKVFTMPGTGDILTITPDATAEVIYFTPTPVPNSFSYVLDNETDYPSVTTDTGTLEITPIATEITITANSASKYYDGTPLTNDGFTYTPADILVEGDTLVAEIVGTITEIGDSLNRVVSYQVLRNVNFNRRGLASYTQDVTNCYTFALPVSGTLSIVDTFTVSCEVVNGGRICPGSNDGTATITIEGGKYVSPDRYEYSIVGDNTGYNNTGHTEGEIILNTLSPDSYTVTATDALGLTATATFSIVERPVITTTTVFECPNNIDTVIKHSGCNITLMDIGTPNFVAPAGMDMADVTIYNNAPADHIYEVGETTVTWVAKGMCGDSVTCDQIIKVSFQTCPDAVDFEGNSYPSVRLGSGCKCWTTENLVSTKYSDGRDIDDVMDYYSYEYPDVATNVIIFGHLYNWYAAADTARYGSVDSVERAYNSGNHIQGICPDGWYLPSDEEYDELNIYPTTDLRSTEYWIRVNGVVNTNATGFNSLPGGMYNCSTGRFESMMGNSYYWTCHPVYDLATGAMIDYICEKIVTNNNSRCNGYSIRCIWGEH